MKFNHLNVPTHWRNYWSRYPEGHTILEALIQWVSQVDSMVDNQNKLNDNVEQFRIEIDAFVERFDERLQDEVTQTLKDWQTSGFLDVVISEALQWQLDDYIATNEQDKLSITAQLQQTEQELNAQLAQIKQETNGKKIKQIGFAVRNDGTGFKFIEDSQHTPLNGVSIEHMPDDFSLKINYGFTAKKVITLVATTDETLAQMGVTVGASVGLDFSILKFGKQDNVFGYMTKSGGDNPIFTIDPQFSNGVKSATWNAYRGSLQVTHDKCNNSVPHCTTRNPLTVAYPSSLSRRSSGFTSSEFRFKNDGNTDVQAIPPDGTVFIFGYSGFFQISLDQLNYEGSNVWVYGIMEVE